MRGIILAGGFGHRLTALTNPLNKHLLPVFDRPMVIHGVRTLVESGLDDIMVLLNGRHPGIFLEMLGDGLELGCHISFRYEMDVRGPGRTLLMAERWIGDEDFVVLLGDGVYFVPLQLDTKPTPHMFVMPLEGFDDPRKYGQVMIDNERVTSIVWKPERIYSNLIQTTCFNFSPDAFTRLRRIGRLVRGEVSITSLTSEYVREGLMKYSLLPPRSYIDCGTIEALHTASIRRREVKASL